MSREGEKYIQQMDTIIPIHRHTNLDHTIESILLTKMRDKRKKKRKVKQYKGHIVVVFPSKKIRKKINQK